VRAREREREKTHENFKTRQIQNVFSKASYNFMGERNVYYNHKNKSERGNKKVQLIKAELKMAIFFKSFELSCLKHVKATPSQPKTQRTVN
jgi:hypothetical protein